MDDWMVSVDHKVRFNLNPYMDIRPLSSAVSGELGYDITLYGISFLLSVRLDEPFYVFEMKRNKTDERSSTVHLLVDYYDEDKMKALIDHVREYAKDNAPEYNRWQIALNDAFTDAGFVWLKTGFDRTSDHVHVGLSKADLNYFFDMQVNAPGGGYYELRNTSNTPIPGSRTDFGPGIPSAASVVKTISGVFRPLAVGGGGAPRSNAPQGSSSAQKVQMQLYEIIVDLLTWVRTHGTESSAPVIAGLLRDIKDTLPRD
jgi:hypothetical protein